VSGGEGSRAVAISLVSTMIFFTLLGVAITHAPGWPGVRRTFFDWVSSRRRCPRSRAPSCST